MKKQAWQAAILTAALVFTVTPAVPFAALAQDPALATQATEINLNAAFAQAAEEFSVPQELLMAISYSETRWQDHADEPSKNNGYGLMHLVDNNTQNNLVEAAKGLRLTKKELMTSPLQNIRGGAYLLAQYQKDLDKPLTADLNDWYEAVGLYFESTDKNATVLFADAVFALLKDGVSLTTPQGQSLSIPANPSIEPNKGRYEGVTDLVSIQSTDYGPALWNAAYSGNYQVASRPGSDPINKVIIHDIEGSYSSAINWFKNPDANVSAHYVIRSSDGQITQMVREKDIAWHARTFNTNSIGIEHEGYANQTGWYTDSMYRASAALVKAICEKYGIAMTRDNILAHSELYGNDHTDPGKYWDWQYFMTLVTGVNKNYRVIQVDDSNYENNFFSKYGTASYWRSATGVGLHNQMTYTNGQGTTSVTDNYAIYRPNIPVAGTYEVKVFIPENNAATTNARYHIYYNGGSVTKIVDQSIYNNAWVSLGTYSFASGTTGYVKLADNTTDKVAIGFDAIKFMAR
ncbi:N-acetylmuramoyl-L-alanine amidase [Tumebacillus sp. DT12]|uniref:N-acetylmuramoyl-L-alanine amidase n=1 Tax=Tumebacillus lacus TaxID=2995335 RepID=A0ABT3X2G8_9BACL|nr:N-acetylmuramoyl-L-alanine amidase [Tumebacillus lacus]MCX7569811.1 N-acetylmuramoyl-L-alanine amidase [Tumebacillus lacus]